MNYNFHTHTTRCSHATGTEEEYILRAIEGGIRHMGFSDHVPLRFSDGFESSYRVPTAQVDAYFETLRALREKYRGQIEIFIGFEMEYYSALFHEMFENVVNAGAEYLILGEHFCEAEHPGPTLHNMRDHSDEASIDHFTSITIEAMQTGVFTYVAHPDLFYFSGDPAVYERHMRRLCRAAVDTATPLEINFLGIRENRHYPCDAFFAIAGQEGSPITFGFDAHTAESACDLASLAKAEAMVQQYGLNYIGEPKLRLLQK